MIGRWVTLLAGAVCMTGCVAVDATGPLQHDNVAMDRDAAEQVHVALRMGAGNMRVSSGTEKLLRGNFDYNVPSWKPEVRYSSAAGSGHLDITQPSGNAHLGSSRNEWDLRLNRDVPLDLSVNFGAGEAKLDLGSLTLRHVEVVMGVGTMDMDLRGAPKHNYDVTVSGGVGELTVHLPATVGVYADASGGIGEISARGMHKDGGRYVNDSYGNAKVEIHLDVHGGIGAIHLISD